MTWLFGRTDYGRAFELFERALPGCDRARGRRCSSSAMRARTTATVALPTLERLAGKARHAYWLNPERRGCGTPVTRRRPQVGEVMAMIECRNLAQLGEFVKALA